MSHHNCSSCKTCIHDQRKHLGGQCNCDRYPEYDTLTQVMRCTVSSDDYSWDCHNHKPNKHMSPCSYCGFGPLKLTMEILGLRRCHPSIAQGILHQHFCF